METQQTEYKKTFGKDVIISLAAFANTDGGSVVVGVDDKGTVCGVEIGEESVQRYQNEIKVTTYPQLFPKIQIKELKKKQILVFEITEFPLKPVAYKSRYYKRLHNSNHLLTLEEIVDLQQQSLSISYDAYPSSVTVEDLNLALIEEFFTRVNERGRVVLRGDWFTNLIRLKLIRDGKVSVAANLLFGVPDYSIRIGRFKSADTIIDENSVKVPLLAAIEHVITFVKKHINLSYHFDGSIQRKERWQYPMEAVRELLLNCIVHRDYKNFSDIIIKIFDDRIVFTNPGRLYGNIRLEDLERDDYVSSIRNRLIAEAFYLTGDIERYGTGFIRIRRFLQGYPELTLNIREVGDFFHVELATKKQVTPQVTPQVLQLLSVLHGQMSRREIQELLCLKDREHFRQRYLKPALKVGLVTMSNPENPRAPDQKYRITESGSDLLAGHNETA